MKSHKTEKAEKAEKTTKTPKTQEIHRTEIQDNGSKPNSKHLCTKVISVAVPGYLYEIIQDEAFDEDRTISEILRKRLMEVYSLKPPRVFLVAATDEEVSELQEEGYKVSKWTS